MGSGYDRHIRVYGVLYSSELVVVQSSAASAVCGLPVKTKVDLLDVFHTQVRGT